MHVRTHAGAHTHTHTHSLFLKNMETIKVMSMRKERKDSPNNDTIFLCTYKNCIYLSYTAVKFSYMYTL